MEQRFLSKLSKENDGQWDQWEKKQLNQSYRQTNQYIRTQLTI